MSQDRLHQIRRGFAAALAARPRPVAHLAGFTSGPRPAHGGQERHRRSITQRDPMSGPDGSLPNTNLGRQVRRRSRRTERPVLHGFVVSRSAPHSPRWRSRRFWQKGRRLWSSDLVGPRRQAHGT